MEITEKVAYLKGLAEGMELDTEKKEGKLLAAIIDVLDDIALEIADMKADQEELSACGMDGASLLTVSLTSGETFTLAIGGQTEDGSYVYAALEAPAPGCDLFLISADKARTLSDPNYESLSADEEAE